MVASLIAEATKHPYQCEEIFGLAHTLLKRLAETSADFLKIEDCVKHWGGLLLNHDRQEVRNRLLSACRLLTIYLRALAIRRALT